MSSEQNLPEVPSHQGPPPSQQQDAMTESGIPHGMGQSKSSRRRRRKRKTTGGDFASESGGGVSAGTLPSLQGQAGQHAPGGAPTSAPQQGSMHNGQQSGQNGQQAGQNGQPAGQPGGAKRWKKKFRDRDRDRPRHADGGGGGVQQNAGFSSPASGPRDTNTHQFGNRSDSFKRKGGSGSGGGGGKQGRDRGPRSFVGPMDHSYRAVNGNFAETPPSTIETHGSAFHGRSKSYHSTGDSQPIDYSQGRTIPVAENAPTRIYFFIDDLFITAKINETARKLGVKVGFMKNEKEVIAEMLALEELSRPGLIVFDLNNANAKPLTLIPKLKAKFKRSTSIVGFLSHLQGDLKAKATEAGCDTVMPRAAFSQNLPNLLRRYGLEEETDDANFNQ